MTMPDSVQRGADAKGLREEADAGDAAAARVHEGHYLGGCEHERDCRTKMLLGMVGHLGKH